MTQGVSSLVGAALGVRSASRLPATMDVIGPFLEQTFGDSFQWTGRVHTYRSAE